MRSKYLNKNIDISAGILFLLNYFKELFVTSIFNIKNSILHFIISHLKAVVCASYTFVS